MPSSLESSEGERCENAPAKSAAKCTEPAAPLEAAAGVCGLRNPVRLSSGTGVMDAEVTSFGLTCGFKWFLSQHGGEKAE